MDSSRENLIDPAGQDIGQVIANRAEEQAPVAGTGGTTAAAAMGKDETAAARQPDYVHIGGAFADWFNGRVRQLSNPSIKLGTKAANVVRLHPDGRLECALHGAEGGEQQTFVAFEAQYLDQLVRRIAVLGQ